MGFTSRSSSISRYSQLNEHLLQCIDQMLAIENVRGCPCEELRNKLQTNTFNLVVVGQFKRGKTSLMNALLAELDFLKDVRGYSNKIFFLLNKADYLREHEIQESVEFSKNVLREAMGSDVKLVPISAGLALEGAITKSGDLIEKSLLPAFGDILNRFLMEEKGNILMLSVTNNLLRMISQSRLEFELEVKPLTTPFDELKEKIRTFEDKKREVEAEKEDFDILLDGETKRLLKTMLDEDLEKFKKPYPPGAGASRRAVP